jgi:hypothetical protein
MKITWVLHILPEKQAISVYGLWGVYTLCTQQFLDNFSAGLSSYQKGCERIF